MPWAKGLGPRTSSLPVASRLSLHPSAISGSVATSDRYPKLQPSCLRIGSPSSMLPCMLMRKERPVPSRARYGYPAPLHLTSHMHWHLRTSGHDHDHDPATIQPPVVHRYPPAQFPTQATRRTGNSTRWAQFRSACPPARRHPAANKISEGIRTLAWPLRPALAI